MKRKKTSTEPVERSLNLRLSPEIWKLIEQHRKRVAQEVGTEITEALAVRALICAGALAMAARKEAKR